MVSNNQQNKKKFLDNLFHPAFALIVGFVLAILAFAQIINIGIAVSAFGAWFVAFVWIAKADCFKQISLKYRIPILLGIAIILAGGFYLLSTWALGEYQRKQPQKEPSTVTKTDLADMEKRLSEKFLNIVKPHKNKIKEKYPMGYFLFANDKQNNFIPLNKEGKPDFSLDWENCRIAFVNNSFIHIVLKNFYYFPTNIKIENLNILFERKIGTIADGISFNNVGLFAELIDDREGNIIYVIGLKKIKSAPEKRNLKPEVEEFIKKQIGTAIISWFDTNVKEYITIRNLTISSGWTIVKN